MSGSAGSFLLEFFTQSQALLNAIKEYETNKWKFIGQKVGKPAKACEQYAKENFPGKDLSPDVRAETQR